MHGRKSGDSLTAERAGAVLQALYPIGRHPANAEGGYPDKKVIIRFHAQDVRAVVSALEDAGFPVIESVEMQKPALAA